MTSFWPFVILQLATVIAIALFLRMLLHKQLNIGMKRIQNIDTLNVQKEGQLNEKLKKINEDYETKIAEAKQVAETLRSAAKEEADTMREAERIKAKDESKRIIASALQQKDKLLKESEDEIFSRLIDCSTQLLRQMFTDDDLQQLRCIVTRDVIEHLFTSGQVRDLLKEHRDVQVISADPLSEEEKKQIIQLLQKHSSAETKVDFLVKKEVLGGIMLQIGAQTIDGSIVYRLSKAAKKLREVRGM